MLFGIVRSVEGIVHHSYSKIDKLEEKMDLTLNYLKAELVSRAQSLESKIDKLAYSFTCFAEWMASQVSTMQERLQVPFDQSQQALIKPEANPKAKTNAAV